MSSSFRLLPILNGRELRGALADSLQCASALDGLPSAALFLDCPDGPLDGAWLTDAGNRTPSHGPWLAECAQRLRPLRRLALIPHAALRSLLGERGPGDRSLRPVAGAWKALATGAVLRCGDSALAAFDEQRHPASGFAYRGPRAAALIESIEQLADVDLAVLIHGETGTGKELVARALHRASRRAAEPWLALNCAEIPEALLASELFGHRRGSFTGADDDRVGLLEAAGSGTVFLDEIGEVPARLQSQLLRVLEERSVRPLGATESRTLGCRVVAATNRNLATEVRAGRFRADLYYRLRGATLTVPALRDRRDELLPLAEMFAARAALCFGRPEPTLDEAARFALQSHDWPGNLRELRQTLECAVATAAGETLGVESLGLDPPRGPDALRTATALASRTVAGVEREHILRALESTDGNKMAAARLLGLSRQSLDRRLRRFGIDLLARRPAQRPQPDAGAATTARMQARSGR